MTQTQSIKIYQEIAKTTTAMLRSAKAKHWQELLGLGAQYQDLVEQLKALDSAPTDDADLELQRKLLQKILHNESTVRELISPELDNLSELMGSGKNQRSAIQAYYDAAKTNTA